MSEQPEPTEEEQEQVQERQGEEEAKRFAGHDDPERPGEDSETSDA